MFDHGDLTQSVYIVPLPLKSETPTCMSHHLYCSHTIHNLYQSLCLGRFLRVGQLRTKGPHITLGLNQLNHSGFFRFVVVGAFASGPMHNQTCMYCHPNKTENLQFNVRKLEKVYHNIHVEE